MYSYSKISCLLLLVLLSSCNKFLDEKPDQALAIPSTLKDLQALLDFHTPYVSSPVSGEISSDDYYTTQADWNSLSSETHRRTYTWQPDYLFELKAADWSNYGVSLYYCNTILEGLTKIPRTGKNNADYDYIKGQALFFRGKTVLQASFIWTLAYDETKAGKDLGLPLRLNTDFNETSIRSSLQDTYDQLIADLKSSVHLLPVKPISYMRASRPATYAALSRAYLSMRRYSQAGLYADSCLALMNELIDYNDLVTSTAPYPFKELNKEVITHDLMAAGQILNLTRARIVRDLYDSYKEFDLRKTLFFVKNTDGSYGFKGRYSGALSLYSGFATDEIYLTRAECFARQGNTLAAMEDLNALLINRWAKGKFQPLVAGDAAEALSIILTERRKELVFRGLRWMDLKRLNKEGAGISLKRIINNEEYTLPPNDLRYALPIPDDVIALSGMSQNLR